jgi:osmotically inducible protein OsmC
MPVRIAEAVWTGTLREGAGTMKVGSGYFEGPFTFGSRFEEDKGTNPEELVGAAEAGCFSMFLAAQLTKEKFPPKRIQTVAHVHLGDGPTITKIELRTTVEAPGIDRAKFQELIEFSKKNCPVSKALTGPEITVQAELIS